ncbi:hypothetical protein ACLB1S_03035 [Escherichia coli]
MYELDPDGEFGLGVAVDVYHVWWDPDLASQICVPENASSRLRRFDSVSADH